MRPPPHPTTNMGEGKKNTWCFIPGPSQYIITNYEQYLRLYNNSIFTFFCHRKWSTASDGDYSGNFCAKKKASADHIRCCFTISLGIVLLFVCLFSLCINRNTGLINTGLIFAQLHCGWTWRPSNASFHCLCFALWRLHMHPIVNLVSFICVCLEFSYISDIHIFQAIFLV